MRPANQMLHGRRNPDLLLEDDLVNQVDDMESPTTIKEISRIKDDIYALRILMRSEAPIRNLVRGNRAMVRYGFGGCFWNWIWFFLSERNQSYQILYRNL